MATIFLVEDNPADVDLFRMTLQESCVDCELVVFEDGREVLDYISGASAAIPKGNPDLIVLDLNLPRNDGLEVLRALRDTQEYATVPIAILSSSSSVRERSTLKDFDICEFIAKPPDLEEYLKIGSIIHTLLEQSKSRPGAEATSAANRFEFS